MIIARTTQAELTMLTSNLDVLMKERTGGLVQELGEAEDQDEECMGNKEENAAHDNSDMPGMIHVQAHVSVCTRFRGGVAD